MIRLPSIAQRAISIFQIDAYEAVLAQRRSVSAIKGLILSEKRSRTS